MRIVAATVLFASALALSVPTYIGSWVLAHQLGSRPAEFSVVVTRGVQMSTSDGITLVSDIYRPEVEGTIPTILVRLPYSKTWKNMFVASVIGRFWAERGYAVVIQGTRGRYESGGTYYPLRWERQDGIATLRWIANQPWFNGRIGMWGGSYFGYTQWCLADQVSPGLSSLMIQIASTNFHQMFFPGGAFSLESALYWAVGSHGDKDTVPAQETLEQGYSGFPLIEADDRAGQDIPFFNDWVEHPTRDQYWEHIDGENRGKHLRAPALLMAGWYDPFLPTQLNDFIQIRREASPSVASSSRLIIGPWAHAYAVTFPGGKSPRNYRLESIAPSLPWFDRHLRGVSTAKQDMAPVRIYVMGTNVWRDEHEWPLSRARYTIYYLGSGGKANSVGGDGVLTRDQPITSAPSDSFHYDPLKPVPTAGGAMLGPGAGIAKQNSIESRSDVLVYTTPPLEEDVEVTGPITAVLYVSTTAAHTDFSVKLVDVHPDGDAYNVSDGIVRRSYGSSLAETGAIPIEVALWPTSMVFFKNHRIRIEVSSSNFPRFDRNPNTGNPIATERHSIVATQTIYHSEAAYSRLILPVIPRESEHGNSPR